MIIGIIGDKLCPLCISIAVLQLALLCNYTSRIQEEPRHRVAIAESGPPSTPVLPAVGAVVSSVVLASFVVGKNGLTLGVDIVVVRQLADPVTDTTESDDGA